MGFVHLHVHTEYSLLDGACRIEKLLDKAKELGHSAVAITDHGNMYGAVEFYKAAKKRGIKPIIGCEVYVAKRTRFDKVHELDSENRHLVLLCKDETGYKNLTAMVSKAWVEGFYSRPRVDFELLEKHSEGLIALSACVSGEIPRALLRNDYEEAKAAAENYRRIFGEENFYLELQDHGLNNEHYVNPSLIKLSRETGIPLVVTNDCHYIEEGDKEMHKVLLCIQTGSTVNDENSFDFGDGEMWFKDEAKMRALFPDLPEAADNTVKIAERCNLEFEFGKTKLPGFETPDGSDNKDYFVSLCFEGLRRRYGEDYDRSLGERLNYEIETVSSMGYVNYYLIVWDFIRYAKSRNIPVGPGRGSGAGSLAAYCMGITNIDPIRYGLIFERFLNPERVSMPDFDIDFSDERRDEVIDYVVQKYGSDHVAQIVTFGTLAAKAAIKDVGRALAIPYSKVDSVSKLIPGGIGVTFDKILDPQNRETRDFRESYLSDLQVKELVDMARKVEGMPRHTSTHAAGVLITDKPVMEYVPLAKNDDVIVTQYTMTAIEELGLLKMDFLGLRYLSIIDNAAKLVQRRIPDFSIETIPEGDSAAYSMLSSGAALGVFQFESDGMRKLLTRAQPKSIEDLTAIISLYRPGPMQFIDMYIENRKDLRKIKYRHEKLEPILGVTYGCIIYQEQVMQIFRDLAGYSLGRADIVRRAMSKKKHDVLERERQVFIHGQKREDGTWEVEGCINRGVDEATAQALFGEIESFASYAFNKSHAAAYATISYQTAFLKRRYPREYMAALLSSVLGMTGKVVEYIGECQRLSIPVLPPHVNYSETGFSVVGNSIRYGLLAVKNLGKGLISRMIEERGTNGEFTSFYNFCKRMFGRDFNKRAIESLIKCGALDGIGSNRREMLLSLDSVIDGLEEDKRRNIEGQLGFFDMGESDAEPALMSAADFSPKDKLAMEKEITGMYLTGHPMADYSEFYRGGAFARTDEIYSSAHVAENEVPRYREGQRVRLLAIVTGYRKKVTKAGADMAFVELEDMYGSISAIAFSKTLEEYGHLLFEGSVIQAEGKLSFPDEKEPELICDKVLPPPKSGEDSSPEQSSRSEQITRSVQSGKKTSRAGLYIRVSNEDSPLYKKAMRYIDIFDEGQYELYIYFTDSSRYVKANKYRVFVNDVLLKALKELLGEENVAFKGH